MLCLPVFCSQLLDCVTDSLSALSKRSQEKHGSLKSVRLCQLYDCSHALLISTRTQQMLSSAATSVLCSEYLLDSVEHVKKICKFHHSSRSLQQVIDQPHVGEVI